MTDVERIMKKTWSMDKLWERVVDSGKLLGFECSRVHRAHGYIALPEKCLVRVYGKSPLNRWNLFHYLADALADYGITVRWDLEPGLGIAFEVGAPLFKKRKMRRPK